MPPHLALSACHEHSVGVDHHEAALQRPTSRIATATAALAGEGRSGRVAAAARNRQHGGAATWDRRSAKPAAWSGCCAATRRCGRRRRRAACRLPVGPALLAAQASVLPAGGPKRPAHPLPAAQRAAHHRPRRRRAVCAVPAGGAAAAALAGRRIPGGVVRRLPGALHAQPALLAAPQAVPRQ